MLSTFFMEMNHKRRLYNLHPISSSPPKRLSELLPHPFKLKQPIQVDIYRMGLGHEPLMENGLRSQPAGVLNRLASSRYRLVV